MFVRFTQMIPAILLMGLLLWALQLRAQDAGMSGARAAQARGAQAYREGDFATSLGHFGTALRLRPNHPGLMYNVAALNALIGNQEAALTLLNKIADMRIFFAAGQDSDFVALRSTEAFRQVLQRFEDLNLPRSDNTVAFKLRERDLVTECVAFDAKTGSFFVSSIHQKK